MKWILLIAALALLLAFDLWLARRESHGAGHERQEGDAAQRRLAGRRARVRRRHVDGLERARGRAVLRRVPGGEVAVAGQRLRVPADPDVVRDPGGPAPPPADLGHRRRARPARRVHRGRRDRAAPRVVGVLHLRRVVGVDGLEDVPAPPRQRGGDRVRREAQGAPARDERRHRGGRGAGHRRHRLRDRLASRRSWRSPTTRSSSSPPTRSRCWGWRRCSSWSPTSSSGSTTSRPRWRRCWC